MVKCNLFPFFLLFVVGRGRGGISGRVRALNLTVPLGSGRVGSDDLGYGPGSGFSFEPVQNSSVCRDSLQMSWFFALYNDNKDFLFFICTHIKLVYFY